MIASVETRTDTGIAAKSAIDWWRLSFEKTESGTVTAAIANDGSTYSTSLTGLTTGARVKPFYLIGTHTASIRFMRVDFTRVRFSGLSRL
jgi:hypothetical protein